MAPNGDQTKSNGSRAITANTSMSVAVFLAVAGAIFFGGKELGDVQRALETIERRQDTNSRKIESMSIKLERLIAERTVTQTIR